MFTQGMYIFFLLESTGTVASRINIYKSASCYCYVYVLYFTPCKSITIYFLSTCLLLPTLLLPVFPCVLVAFACILFCVPLSNVFFGIPDCSIEPCGIECRFAMDVWLFWVCRMPHNREGWVLFFLLVDLMFSGC